MTRASLSFLALVAAFGCASSPSGRLRVEPAGADAGPGSAQERALVEAVQGAAEAEGLGCQPGAGVRLLRCAPGALGNRGRALVLTLAREGSGYSVSIEQGVRLRRSTAACETQRRVADRIAAALGAQAVRVDTRSECGPRAR